MRIDDSVTEQRWPRWTAAVAGTGLRSCVSAPLVAGDESLGAIKVYAYPADAFGPHTEHLVRMFAGQAAVLVANVQSAERSRRMTEELRSAIRSRDVISVAKGILMAREGVGEEDALGLLIALARREQRGLADVARGLVFTSTRRRR